METYICYLHVHLDHFQSCKFVYQQKFCSAYSFILQQRWIKLRNHLLYFLKSCLLSIRAPYALSLADWLLWKIQKRKIDNTNFLKYFAIKIYLLVDALLLDLPLQPLPRSTTLFYEIRNNIHVFIWVCTDLLAHKQRTMPTHKPISSSQSEYMKQIYDVSHISALGTHVITYR